MQSLSVQFSVKVANVGWVKLRSNATLFNGGNPRTQVASQPTKIYFLKVINRS